MLEATQNKAAIEMSMPRTTSRRLASARAQQQLPTRYLKLVAIQHLSRTVPLLKVHVHIERAPGPT